MPLFEETLKTKYNINPDNYLTIAKHQAEKLGYDPTKLKFSKYHLNKLDYDGVLFGHRDYKDFIIYALLFPLDFAKERRRLYLARSRGIKGDWAKNPNSPNNLARIIW